MLKPTRIRNKFADLARGLRSLLGPGQSRATHTDRSTARTVFSAALFLVAAAPALFPRIALAQTDEIQVYDAEIEQQGKFNVMVHSNFYPHRPENGGLPGQDYPQSVGQRSSGMGLRGHRLV